MAKLNLDAKSETEKVIKTYLEANVSDSLASEINDGIQVKQDGVDLIAKKTLAGCVSFLCEQARKQAKVGAAACVPYNVVFGWAMHYFEEESIKADLLFNLDGTPYKKQPSEKTKTANITHSSPVQTTTKETPAKTAKKPESMQVSLFDMLGGVK